MAKVTIDAGHGGYDGGANYNGRLEKNDNLDIALAVGELLEQNGIEVGYTRVTDVYDSPGQKARIANEQGSDLFVSIHRNSSPNPNTYSGVETLLYDESGLKKDVANAINEELEKVGFNNLGLNVRKDLTVLRRTQMPAVLVEVGFINTDADNQLLDDEFNETAYAIANGIFKTLTGAELQRNYASVRNTNFDNDRDDDYDYDDHDDHDDDHDHDDDYDDHDDYDNHDDDDYDDHMVLPGMPQGPLGPELPQDMTGPQYRVQVGLYREYRNALNIAYELELLGFPVDMRVSGDFYAVQVGPFMSRAEAIMVENQLQMLGYDTLVMESDPMTHPIQ